MVYDTKNFFKDIIINMGYVTFTRGFVRLDTSKTIIRGILITGLPNNKF